MSLVPRPGRGGALRVALCSVDPIGLTTFDSFDPDSFSLMSTLADGLVYVDSDGQVQPALATSWQRTSPLSMEFELRQGVRFHDGSGFDSEDVVATFEAHRSPTPSACGGGILSPIVGVTALGSHRVRIETAFPDAMLLRRLFFGQIYAKSVLRSQGREAIARHPVATGAYRLVSWERGREIVLERHPGHWAGMATVDRITLPIVRKKEWVERLANGDLDVAFNADALDVVLARSIEGLTVQSRPGSVSHTFLLRNEGPLADLRVRKALNHALQRRILVELSEHGLGEPQRSVSTRHEEGATELEAYRYSPELARSLLAEAGYPHGLRLRGVVSETSAALYHACREFLGRVGVELDAEIVPATEWMSRIVLGNLRGVRYDTDFALTCMGNPLAHSLFLQFANLFGGGPGSLTRDAAYDAQFLAAATEVEPERAAAAQAQLERYAVSQALMLFTVEQRAHCISQRGCQVVLPLSGLPTGVSFWSLRAPALVERAPLSRLEPQPDYSLLLEGTSHTGTFYLPPATVFREPAAARIWSNILVSQERWRLQNRPLLREVVTLVETKDNLANVLGSTDRVAIVGYSDQGRRLFVNRGYERMLGDDPRPVTERLPPSGDKSWPAIRAAVDSRGSWLGPVEVEVGAGHRSLYLTVSPAVDEERVRIGYTFVFSDFSGEEERIRHQAIRTILDNVPYALFACDREGRLLPGYSATCRDFFRGASFEGRPLVELLELPDAQRELFRACYEQLMDDILPSELSLAQLPARLAVGPRICGLSGSLLRQADGAPSGALFTLIDMTELVAAEQEAERMRGLVAVLRFRSSFERFVRGLDAELEALQARPSPPDLRRLLHTAKGVFGQFSLHALAQLVHEVEEEEPVTVAQVRRVQQAVRQTLAEHQAVWGIELQSDDTRFGVADSQLRALQQRVAEAASLSEAQRLVRDGLEGFRQRRISELVGPLQESCARQAARAGKQVRVALRGFELEVPLRLAPALSCLVHLVRNAIDHGLEAPEERGSKDPVGTLTLEARPLEHALEIEVADDGRGIDTDALLARAIERGALTAVQARALSREEALQLVFVDGLSTAESVTETSGRGVGASAVRQAVCEAGGSMHLHSEAFAGTRWLLHLPR
jgi:peptide/nickel transport system substrate-binding protein